ncbi:hypothetical protein [Mucilaginibacter myungsuensis]|uniref:Uncharacterized protein n=1 Tax=Mucilaginibacter myungsuensis TaxID=649104 RepID=A0A929KW48_9SPHI|nr:hypothetical protein [Mucilaginibacter myungsuensis]MBE9661528.1 hypothetical protein [Mucilaginibacter myungsuensis]MDN3597671.1 hypothetical protein [Mucilaginibacter myungsuensis]
MNTIQIKVTDATFGGKILNQITVALASERVTVKDIIEARVIKEVQDYNSTLPEVYRGFIQPTNAEVALNGYKLPRRDTRIDAEQQVYTALDAFQQNGFFVLIDNKQAEDLDQEVLLTTETTVSFLKLTPLVGG